MYERLTGRCPEAWLWLRSNEMTSYLDSLTFKWPTQADKVHLNFKTTWRTDTPITPCSCSTNVSIEYRVGWKTIQQAAFDISIFVVHIHQNRDLAPMWQLSVNSLREHKYSYLLTYLYLLTQQCRKYGASMWPFLWILDTPFYEFSIDYIIPTLFHSKLKAQLFNKSFPP